MWQAAQPDSGKPIFENRWEGDERVNSSQRQPPFAVAFDPPHRRDEGEPAAARGCGGFHDDGAGWVAPASLLLARMDVLRAPVRRRAAYDRPAVCLRPSGVTVDVAW